MRSALILFLLIASTSFGHEYFFGFAEVEYNDISRKFEITLSMSAHDMELVLQRNYINEGAIEDVKVDLNAQQMTLQYISSHFQLSNGEERAILEFQGMEITQDGIVHFYISSKPIEISDALEVRFDLLMDEFEQQENKTTILYRGKSYTEAFPAKDRTRHKIKLEDE